jgi:phage-related protein
MITVTEPQVWTVIGVLAATLVSFVAASLTMITRTVNVQFERVSEKIDLSFNGLRNELKGDIGGLRSEVKGDINGLRSELKGDIGELRTELKGEIGGLRGELAALNTRFDTLDRDVQAIANRMWGEKRP